MSLLGILLPFLSLPSPPLLKIEPNTTNLKYSFPSHSKIKTPEPKGSLKRLQIFTAKESLRVFNI